MGTRLNLAVSRIPNQFSASAKYIDFLREFVTCLEDVDSLLASLATLRWLDTAEGIWLDTVGEIIGIPRFYGENTGPFFTYKDAYPGTDDPTLAYSGPLPDPPTGGHYQSLYGISSGTLIDDDEYRKWIKAKAKATGTAGTLRDIWVFISEVLEITSHVVQRGSSAGYPRVVQVVTITPITPWKQSKIREWAPVNAGIDMEFIV